MINTATRDYRHLCLRCGQFECDCTYEEITKYKQVKEEIRKFENSIIYIDSEGIHFKKEAKTVPEKQRASKGWICPLCGSGVSPTIDICPCKK